MRVDLKISSYMQCIHPTPNKFSYADLYFTSHGLIRYCIAHLQEALLGDFCELHTENMCSNLCLPQVAPFLLTGMVF